MKNKLKIIGLRGFAFLAVALLSFSANSQNLVPNPSVENYTTCPTGVAQIDNVVGWAKVVNHTGSADYMNVCNATNVDVPNNAFGSQLANSGDGYFGFALIYNALAGFREYTYCHLIQRLQV
jgi:hypothetical protein